MQSRLSRAEVTCQIGRRIAKARADLPALTPDLVAAFLGISVVQYIDLECGRVRPTSRQIMLLADLMDVTPRWFFLGIAGQM